MMAMQDYQWLLNNGIAVAIVVFTGFVLWRVLVGSKATGYQGILIRWAKNLAQEAHNHQSEVTAEFSKASKERGTQVSALQLLVESQAPLGAAFIAAKAVHQTAENVVQLRAAVLQATKMCRAVATRFPELEADIDRHCDEIERIIGEA